MIQSGRINDGFIALWIPISIDLRHFRLFWILINFEFDFIEQWLHLEFTVRITPSLIFCGYFTIIASNLLYVVMLELPGILILNDNLEIFSAFLAWSFLISMNLCFAFRIPLWIS